MECRKGCGACCVAISISSPLPGMPQGKPSGVRCIHLRAGLCGLFGKPERPRVCGSFQASPDFCGDTATEATALILRIEEATRPRSATPEPQP